MQSENKQTIANRKYREKNREKTNQQAYKRSGKLFILNYATEEDLQLFESYIQERRKKKNTKRLTHYRLAFFISQNLSSIENCITAIFNSLRIRKYKIILRMCE